MPTCIGWLLICFIPGPGEKPSPVSEFLAKSNLRVGRILFVGQAVKYGFDDGAYLVIAGDQAIVTEKSEQLAELKQYTLAKLFPEQVRLPLRDPTTRNLIVRRLVFRMNRTTYLVVIDDEFLMGRPLP